MRTTGATRVGAAEVALIVLFVAFLVGMTAVYSVFVSGIRFWPGPAETVDYSVPNVLAIAGAVAAPIVGVVVAASIGRRGAVGLFGVLLAIGFLATTVTLAHEPSTSHGPTIVPTTTYRNCVEHSGGDTTCPEG